MTQLEQHRKEIDQIDQELTRLIERRFDVAKKVALYKNEQGLPVLDATREERVIKKNQDRLTQSEYNTEIAEFYIHLMAISRGIQEQILADN